MSLKMSKRKAYSGVRYTALSEKNGDYFDSQFELKESAKVPWKTVTFAIVLCCTGFAMLVAGIMISCGLIDSMFQDRMWPFLTLGILTFVPGIYHVRIAYYAYKEFPGYSFDDIPEFE